MSIKSGQRYKITNEQTKLVVDLSAADNKSIIGWNYHGGENQQVMTFDILKLGTHNRDTFKWIPEEQDDGQWTIQSVTAQKYLGFEKAPDDGTPLVGLDNPQTWEIEILDCDDPVKTNVKYVFRTNLEWTPLIVSAFKFLRQALRLWHHLRRRFSSRQANRWNRSPTVDGLGRKESGLGA